MHPQKTSDLNFLSLIAKLVTDKRRVDKYKKPRRVNCQINRRLPQIQSLVGLIGLSCFWDPRGTAENRHEKNFFLSLFQRVAGLDDVKEREREGGRRRRGERYIHGG